VADTERTLTALLALLADNTTGDISPQDLRDYVVSTLTAHGKLSRLVAAPTTIATPGTYVKAAGTSQAGSSNHKVTVADNRLTYTGDIQRHFHIVATATLQSAANNVRLGVKVAKNGVPMDDSLVAALFKATGDEIPLACHADCQMVNGDYIEVFVTNETDPSNVTMTECYFFAMGFLNTGA